MPIAPVPNGTGVGATEFTGSPSTVPVSVTFWDRAGFATLTLSVALFMLGLAAVGLKSTLTVQLAPGASVAGNVPQVVVRANWLAYVPPSERPVIFIGAVPALVMVTVCPALVTLSGELKPSDCWSSESTGDTAVPVSSTGRGLAGSLFAMTRVAVLGPGAVGLNFTVTVQLFPAPRVVMHEVDRVKSAALAPVTVMSFATLAIFNAVVLVLTTDTTCPALAVPSSCGPKVSAVVLTLSTVPAPPSDAEMTGCAGSFVLRSRPATFAPPVTGENVMRTVHVDPGATFAGRVPQVLPEMENSAALAPVRPMAPMASDAVPEFDTTTVWAALVVPSKTSPKATDGVTEATGTTPVPMSITVSMGFVGSLLLIVTLPALPPVAVGVKVTLMLQFSPAARLAPQPFVCEKSPVVPMLMPVSGAVPVFERVTVTAELIVLSI